MIVVDVCHVGLTAQDGSKTRFEWLQSESAFLELWIPCLTDHKLFVRTSDLTFLKRLGWSSRAAATLTEQDILGKVSFCFA